jgi:hypothetical protein
MERTTHILGNRFSAGHFHDCQNEIVGFIEARKNLILGDRYRRCTLNSAFDLDKPESASARDDKTSGIASNSA